MPEKVKIEIVKEDGTKIKIEVPSNDPELIYTYLKTLQSIPSKSNIDESSIVERESAKVIERVEDLVRNEFGLTFFTLSDIYRLYTLKYNDHVSKSTLSTYLNRLVDYGVLIREGRRGRYKYRLKMKV